MIGIAGMLTQILVTGKGTYHEAQFPPLNNRRRPKPESREDRRVKKYRYLYQVRISFMILRILQITLVKVTPVTVRIAYSDCFLSQKGLSRTENHHIM